MNLFGKRSKRRAERDHLFFELRDTLATAEACPVCTLLERRDNRAVENLFGAFANDPGVREKLRASGGLCRFHTAKAVRLASPFSLALLAEDLLIAWERSVQSPRAGAPCPLCRMREEAEERLLQAMAELLEDPDFLASFRSSKSAFCRRHYRAIQTRLSSEHLRQVFASHQRQSLKGYERTVMRILRKADYRFQHEQLSKEEAARVRALWFLLAG